MPKSENTIENLHTHGKLDKKLSRNFYDEKKLLDKARRKIILGLHSPHRKELHKILVLQWKITRTIFQQSDEYKETKGI